MREHVGNLSEPELLKLGVWNRLGALGIQAPSRKRSRSKRVSSTPCSLDKKKSSRKPGSASSSISSSSSVAGSSLFGISLRDLPKSRVPLGEENDTDISVDVPEFLPRILGFIRQDLGRVGIFRLSGSEARQRALRERLEAATDCYGQGWAEESSVIDAAAILKHWLRELPEPVVPDNYQEVMLRCCSLDSDRALRLSTLLLPESSSSTLSYLFRFFYDVTRQSSENKMDVRNLAIVLAPSFFPIPPAKKGSSLESTKNILNLKTQILERLIINANQICMVDGPLAEEYSSNILKMAPNFSSQSEDNSEYPPGPSERRSRKKKKKKHRRSGSLSRVITAFKGIISRSTTPSAASSSNSRRRNSGATPDSFLSQDYLGSSAVKRKASKEEEVCQGPCSELIKSSVSAYSSSSPSKIPKLLMGLETPLTPKLRGKSFSVKRFKKKKSLCKTKSNGEATQLVNYSPLRSRICLLTNQKSTPQTPDFLAGTLAADRDLSDEERPIIKGRRGEEEHQYSSSLARRVVLEHDSTPSDTHPNDDSSSSSSNPFLLLNNSLRRGQPNSLSTGLSKPSLSHPSEEEEFPKLKREDSLAHLKKDLSILIESSFALGSSSSLEGAEEESIPARLPASSNNVINARHVKELISKMKSIDMASPLTRSRRQSLEGGKAGNSGGGAQTRRMSSTLVDTIDSGCMSEGGLKRGESLRASLARKNSSVKDLVRRIESSKKKIPSFGFIPEDPVAAAASLVSEVSGDLMEDQQQWVDATEFFKTVPYSMEEHSGRADEEIDDPDAPFEGCKRSSIIRIRNENRGKVSKSVETFTQPRRASARMGVSTAPPTPFVTKRRTQTGIRTTVAKRVPHKNEPSSQQDLKRSSSAKPKKDGEAAKSKKDAQPQQTTTRRGGGKQSRKHNKTRRHLTIGYLGEEPSGGTRSPLRERVNVITVQRSKSAQNPTQREVKKKKRRNNSSGSENHHYVQRSHSYKRTDLTSVPMALKDTLYDDSRERVRRNLSDRVMTPTKGGLKNEAIPYMKSVRSRTAASNTPSSSAAAPGATPPHKIHKLSLNTPPVRKSPRLAKIY